jgi:MFS family permease
MHRPHRTTTPGVVDRTDRPTRPAPATSPTLGIAALTGFCVIMAGPNVPIPLLPVYVEQFTLDPLDQAVLYSSYLVALVAVLRIMARRTGPRTLPVLLATAVFVSVLADVTAVLGAQTLPLLLAGRALSGISVGLGTGAASAVILVALGSSARTLIASGSILGSLVGVLGSGVVGTLMPAPTITAYLVHAAAAAAVLWPLLWLYRREAHLLAQGFTPQPSAPMAPLRGAGPLTRRHRVAGLLIGCLAWTGVCVHIALVPAAVRAGHDVSLLTAVLPVACYLGASYAAQQIVRPHLKQVRGWQVLGPLVAGHAALGAALAENSLTLLFLAALLAGAAQGPAYALGLATMTYGLSPTRQARVASTYAAVTYGFAALAVLSVGATATAIEVPNAILLLAALFAALGTGAVAAAGARQDFSSLD